MQHCKPLRWCQLLHVLPWILSLTTSSPLGNDEAPFRTLEDTVMSLSSSDSQIPFNGYHHSSHLSPSTRARVEHLPLHDQDLFPFARSIEDDTQWDTQNLDIRSFLNHKQERNIESDTAVSSQRAFNGLKLHLETASTYNSIGSNNVNSDSEQQYRMAHKKTGTTICGCVCQGHVLLAADTRATQNTIVADQTAQKLHPLAQNAWCAGAGTSADLEMTTRLCLYSLSLEALVYDTIGNQGNSNDTMSDGRHLNINRERRISSSLCPMYTSVEKEEEKNSLLVGNIPLARICSFLQDRLWKSKGQLGVNLILGCVDPVSCNKDSDFENGKTAHLRAFHPHGSMDVDLPFAALGSGGLAAMSIMERGYRRNMTVPEATKLVQTAIVAGIKNDLGSGSQVDLCIIFPDGTSKMKRCVVPSQVLDDFVNVSDSENNCCDDDDDDDIDNNDILTGSLGTNGFGNTPFGIQSKRTLASVARQSETSAWMEILDM